MTLLKKKKIKFYRATITRSESGYRPNNYTSAYDIKNELLGKGGLDISGFQSNYAGKLLWGVGSADEVSNTFLSVVIALSRFIAMYALDKNFREEFRNDPRSFAIINAEYEVAPEDLFIFTEGGDKKLYPYAGNDHLLEKGHLIAQKLDPASEHVKVVSFDDIIMAMEMLTVTQSDASMRIVGDMYETAGFSNTYYMAYECVLLEDDGENRTWKRVIDSLNIAFHECKKNIKQKGLNITSEQLIDIVARRITELLTLTRFQPKLIELDQYKYEMRTREFKPINIVPEMKFIEALSNGEELKRQNL